MTITARVRAGIAWLDAYGPKNWRSKIKKAIEAGRFNLNSPQHCALGEVYGDYNDAIDKYNIDDEATKAMGFDEDPFDDVTFDALTDEWTRQYALGRKASAKGKGL